MANKLSIVQQTALNRLREEYEANPKAWFSAYDLKQSSATLNALYKRNLIERRSGLGSMAFPRSSIMYRFNPVPLEQAQ